MFSRLILTLHRNIIQTLYSLCQKWKFCILDVTYTNGGSNRSSTTNTSSSTPKTSSTTTTKTNPTPRTNTTKKPETTKTTPPEPKKEPTYSISGDKYTCDECQYSTTNKGWLDTHMSGVHKDAP